jgi:hypothetical protein
MTGDEDGNGSDDRYRNKQDPKRGQRGNTQNVNRLLFAALQDRDPWRLIFDRKIHVEKLGRWYPEENLILFMKTV